MLDYDLCVAWNWEYDADFITLLEAGCRAKEMSLLQITPGNLAEVLHSLAEQEIACRAFFDRAPSECLRLKALPWVDSHRSPLPGRLHGILPMW